jgi:UDP-N-acetyl-D-mannosaminuronate dehydrogenase
MPRHCLHRPGASAIWPFQPQKNEDVTVDVLDHRCSDQNRPDQPVRRAADLGAEVASADLVILLQDHSAYSLDRISRDARLVLDTRGRTEGAHIEVL